MIFEKIVVSGYRGMMYTRCDDTESVFYFSAKDFPGLISEAYSFKSSMGHTLQGYVYNYEDYDESRIIVFDHGFGGGHRAYMKEIEKLCAHGYRVFAYDHTGCMESGGESPNGLGQSLCDLNDCLSAIKADERFSGLDISVMGHSWGGFSTLNIPALHTEVSHIVVMCGFVSVEEMVKSFFSGLLKGYRRAVSELERGSNPRFYGYNGIESLKNTKTRALLIYSDNDMLCRRTHYDMLEAALSGKENIKLMLVKGKGHNPNYTENALKHLQLFTKARGKLLKKKKLTAEKKANFVASFDWNAMTEQDESVWDAVFKHLDN